MKRPSAARGSWLAVLQTQLGAPAAGVREAGWTPEAAGGPRISLLLDRAPAPPTPANLRRFLGALLKQLQVRVLGPEP